MSTVGSYPVELQLPEGMEVEINDEVDPEFMLATGQIREGDITT